MYCGKRSVLSFKEMTRPALVGGDKYECPAKTKPCNEDFFDQEGGHDYVICIPENEKIEEACPITSVALSPDQIINNDLYE